MMSESREKGLALFREVYGDAAASGMQAYMETEDFGVECARWTADFGFGQVWTREALDRKLRSCVVLGMMIALRQQEEVCYHTKMGIANGLSVTEIEEILYTAVPYCGFPATNPAKAAMRKALGELGLNK